MREFGDFAPEYTNEKNSAIVILPIPYDGTSTYQKGADKGPEALLESSYNLEFYDILTESEAFTKGIHTAPPVTEASSPEAMALAAEMVVAAYLNDDKFVVSIGGEHSVSIGPINAYVKKYKNLTILQLDAHSDLRDEYLGSKYNHACVMARAKEVAPILQVGIRSMDTCELKQMDKSRVVFAHEMRDNKEWINKITSQLTDNVYITIDLDGFDPAYLPATGTPEPGGMDWWQAVDLIRAVNKKSNIVGFDIVELCPSPMHKASDFFAAKLLYQILGIKYFD
jgi:agmatinase